LLRFRVAAAAVLFFRNASPSGDGLVPAIKAVRMAYLSHFQPGGLPLFLYTSITSWRLFQWNGSGVPRSIGWVSGPLVCPYQGAKICLRIACKALKTDAAVQRDEYAETRMVKGYLTLYMPVGISPVVVGGCTEPLSAIQRIAPPRRHAGLMTISLINLQGW